MSLRARISLSLIFLFAAGSLYQVLNFRSFFLSDKIAYLSETRSLKTEAAAGSLSLALQAYVLGFAEGDPRATEFLKPTTDAQRLPEIGEVFVQSLTGRNKIALFRNARGQVMSVPLDLGKIIEEIPVFDESQGLLATQAGALQAYFGISESAATGDSLKRLRGLLSQNVSQGQTMQLNSLGQDWLVGLQGAERTNLLLYIEVPLEELFAPMRKTVQKQLGVSLGILLALLLVVQILFRALTEPLSGLVDMFRLIGSGAQNAPWPKMLPEFGPIRSAVEKMNSDLTSRRLEIEMINRALEDILIISENVQGMRKGSRMDLLIWLVPQIESFVKRYFSDLLATPATFVAATDHKQGLQTKAWTISQEKFLTESTEMANADLVDSLETSCVEGEELSWIPTSALPVHKLFEPAKLGSVIAKLGSEEFGREMFLVFFPQDAHISPIETRVLKLFCSSISKVLERLYLDEVTLDNQKTLVEVNAAKEIQRASLILPEPQYVMDLNLDSFYRPSDLVGGDWFGVFYHPKIQTLNIYIGDVTGHGISSAFLGCLASGAIQSEEMKLQRESTAAESAARLVSIAETLNSLFFASAGGKKSMTMLMCSVHLPSNALTYLSCGHPFPLLLSPDNKTVKPVMCPPSSVLGMDKVPKFKPMTTTVNKGETLILFTDGFLEAQKKRQAEHLGNSGFRKLIVSCFEGNFEKLNQKNGLCHRLVDQFDKVAVPEDDLAVVSLTF